MADGVSVRLQTEPLDAAAAIRAVSSHAVGGIDLFIGVTRAQEDAALGPLTALEYHAYPEMAQAEMGRLVEAARCRWPVLRVALWHRVGVVALGEASVIVAVGCAHRGDAFETCRYLIDALKKTVPIWKKELHAKDARWQGQE